LLLPLPLPLEGQRLICFSLPTGHCLIGFLLLPAQGSDLVCCLLPPGLCRLVFLLLP
jgi:hypothetical protein